MTRSSLRVPLRGSSIRRTCGKTRCQTRSQINRLGPDNSLCTAQKSCASCAPRRCSVRDGPLHLPHLAKRAGRPASCVHKPLLHRPRFRAPPSPASPAKQAPRAPTRSWLVGRLLQATMRGAISTARLEARPPLHHRPYYLLVSSALVQRSTCPCELPVQMPPYSSLILLELPLIMS